MVYFYGAEKYFSRYSTLYFDRTRPDNRTLLYIIFLYHIHFYTTFIQFSLILTFSLPGILLPNTLSMIENSVFELLNNLLKFELKNSNLFFCQKLARLSCILKKQYALIILKITPSIRSPFFNTATLKLNTIVFEENLARYLQIFFSM